jgi:hypothetical protein
MCFIGVRAESICNFLGGNNNNNNNNNNNENEAALLTSITITL